MGAPRDMTGADDTRSDLRQRVKALARRNHSAQWALAYALLEVEESRAFRVWGYSSMNAYVLGDQILPNSTALSQHLTMARTARAAKQARREWMERQSISTAYQRVPPSERVVRQRGSGRVAADPIGATDNDARIDRTVEILTDAAIIIERGLPHEHRAVRAWFARLLHAVEVERVRAELPACEQCGAQGVEFEAVYRRAQRFVCTRRDCLRAAARFGKVAVNG